MENPLAEPCDVLMDDRATESIQPRLRGLWQDIVSGCPHRHGFMDSVDLCDANEMSPCVYELGDGPCELFQEILDEWKEEENDKTDVG